MPLTQPRKQPVLQQVSNRRESCNSKGRVIPGLFFIQDFEKMLRSTFLVFIAGWIAWFWIDKPDTRQFRMPRAGDSMLDNFQTAFDMLKAGYIDMSFVYLWNAHYLMLSLLGGALLAAVYGGVGDYLGRRRMRRHFLPPARRQAPTAADNPPEPGAGTAQQNRPSE